MIRLCILCLVAACSASARPPDSAAGDDVDADGDTSDEHAEPASCGEHAEEIESVLEDIAECAVDAECMVLELPCLAPCGAAVNGHRADDARRTIQRFLDRCGHGCEEAACPPRPPTLCADGRCSFP